MKHNLGVCFILVFAIVGSTSEGASVLANVAFCELFREPAMYAGKMVRVRAIVHGHPNSTLSEGASQKGPCSAFMRIGLEFPSDVNPRPVFNLEQDKPFHQLQANLEKGMGVMATLEGRFDPVFTWKNQKRVRVRDGKGFGPKHLNDGRIVLHKVSDVVTIPIMRPR